jgi:PAS domain S-box-containing protein
MGIFTGNRGRPPSGIMRRAALFSAPLVLLLPAHASEAVQPYEGGEVGLAGMLAGLLIFALVALYNHQRANRGFAARIHELEKALEARDDRIWSLEERLSRATELVDAQGDLVVREDESGRVTHASAAACALLGKPLEEIIGRDIGFHVMEQSGRTNGLDGSVTYDQEIASPGGTRWIAWKEVAMRDESGRVIEVQRVGRDVTGRVLAEHALADARTKAEAASRAKSRFLAVVSHEVRTPLNGILGMADLLVDTKLTSEQETYARAVKTSGDALLGLIEEILDFSKIEAGRLDIQSMPFDLPKLVTDIVELVAPRAQEKGIEIAADLADDLPLRVAGDAARLRQVLLNLAGNAVKFTDAGGVSVVVDRLANGFIRFAVSDTGPGIGDEARARIFHEFEQGDATLARRHGGTGLGLAIAARIVEGMGGEIALESNEEKGSRFSFAVELPEVEAAAALPAHNLTGADILIASPSPVVGPMIARRLGQWGANVSLASNPEIAESLLPERHWAHVLVDRAFGADKATKLARASQRYTNYRHILLSPAERGELASLKDAGFESYLIKPVRGVSLAARLQAPDWSPPLMPDLESMEGQLAESGGRPLMILVAEDNDINAMLIQALLTKLGHMPTMVADGVSAVASFATAQAVGAPYDAVLMDLHLPGLDGLEATRKIRVLGGNVPVIALTANAFPEDREACFAAGMDEFVTKPVSRERLVEAIEKARAARGAERLSHAI